MQRYKIYFVCTRNLNNRLFFLIEKCSFFLTHEKTEYNESDAEPFSERQLFAEEEPHPEGGEDGSDIIECIGLCYPDLTQREAEEDKSDHGGKDGEVGNAAERNPELRLVIGHW